MSIIEGLDLLAFTPEGVQVSYFEVVEIKGLYYGVHKIDTTDREFLELRVNK